MGSAVSFLKKLHCNMILYGELLSSPPKADENMASPTLLIAENLVRANLSRMADRAHRHGLDFRPHFKTHQSQEVAEWIKAAGVKEISVTSLRMARDFAAGGWKGITIAMPLNPGELAEINQLAELVPTTVFINNQYAAALLRKEGHASIRCYTELNAGYGRSGVDYTDKAGLANLLKTIGPDRFRGYYVHSGHTYDTVSTTEIGQIHQQLLDAISVVKSYPFVPSSCEFTIGDTPACSTQEDFSGVNSIGPGNFIYYDLVQSGLGSCSISDIAVCLASPVLELNAQDKTAILHAGWVQLGKDRLNDGTYGRLVRLKEDLTWDADEIVGKMIKLSQEHGTAVMDPDVLSSLTPGDMIGILPVHACAMVHGMRATGPQKIVGQQ